jgi:hypothetical protein
MLHLECSITLFAVGFLVLSILAPYRIEMVVVTTAYKPSIPRSRQRLMVLHCSKTVIDDLVYLKLTPMVIQSRNAAEMNGSQPNWDARGS